MRFIKYNRCTTNYKIQEYLNSELDNVYLSPDSIHICFNKKGRIEIVNENEKIVLHSSHIGFFYNPSHKGRLRIVSGYDYKLIVISIKIEYLQEKLYKSQFLLKDHLREIIFNTKYQLVLSGLRELDERDKQWLTNLNLLENMTQEALLMFSDSVIMQFLAYNLFKPLTLSEDLFCEKIKKQESERIIKTKAYINNFYSEKFNLNRLATQIGCSSSYLSRLFSKEAGMSIKNYLTMVRVREARRKILSGDFNVTEAAFDSGYNSLSHFSKAFKEEFGYLPSHLKVCN